MIDPNQADPARDLPAPHRLRYVFGALAHRDFRLFWFGGFMSFVGTWIQTVAQGSLVFDLTHDPNMLGITAFLGSVPMLVLSPVGGLVSDRFTKKRVLYITQSVFGLTAIAQGLLILTGRIEIWHLMVAALTNGIFFSIDAPVRLSMVHQLVGHDDLANGIALNSGTFNLARLVGPWIGGTVLARWGAEWCFLANGLSFMAVLLALAVIRASTAPQNDEHEPLWQSLTVGTRYVAQTPPLRTLALMVAASSTFGFAYLALMPAVQEVVLQVGKAELGQMFSWTGLGSLAGVLILAARSRSQRKGLVAILAMVGFGASLLLFALVLAAHNSAANPHEAWAARWMRWITPGLDRNAAFTLACASLALLGGFGVAQMALSNTLVQTYAPPSLRGRVLAVHIWSMQGFLPFGQLAVGKLARSVGTPNALLCGALFTLTASILALAFGKHARALH